MASLFQIHLVDADLVNPNPSLDPAPIELASRDEEIVQVISNEQRSLLTVSVTNDDMVTRYILAPGVGKSVEMEPFAQDCVSKAEAYCSSLIVGPLETKKSDLLLLQIELAMLEWQHVVEVAGMLWE